MTKLLLKGENGALLEVCNTSTKYELVSAWGYDEESQSWAQGHYFTLWGGDITEENKKKLYERALIGVGRFDSVLAFRLKSRKII